MEHTNSQRGPDGRFGESKGPKARRIEVWLQPQTVELLDTLTKQWGVGRGKVIDQLITRGPVPPESWTKVAEASKPTPSAPQEPETRIIRSARRGVEPGPKQRVARSARRIEQPESEPTTVHVRPIHAPEPEKPILLVRPIKETEPE